MGLSTSPGPVATPVPHVGAGVVWDLGNVLIDWDASRAIAAGVGEDEAARFLGADDFDFRAYNHGPDSGMTWDEAEAAVARSHPHWLAHARAYRAHFPASLVGEVPGTPELVRALHAGGVPQWGLTNWSHELYPHAPRMFEVLALLEDVVVSGTEGLAKPDPRVYELLVARTGRALGELVFVDDRPENVDAAVALGMTGLVFTDAEALRVDLAGLGLPL
ncbi:Alpha-D-glucose-1-phosphate phosphatase YihX [Nocardioides dokdonensis FR1436]|uniref:Alpha-D-glucose-1-phosphate phosphatase YihX n=1 Tax=Nocardioides dokdonensis FR1436 TaxID=1300347 RepID=A0A1A9GLQ1_9ACTN|nr:HAD family phosphatase [Nocardioides dokdonensis]ANH38385.1 Alpha-D-glucose-1-phosphate phosphatase YihX [Nocardioides dokdonensis FR1436]